MSGFGWSAVVWLKLPYSVGRHPAWLEAALIIQSGCTILHSHKQCKRVPLFSTSHSSWPYLFSIWTWIPWLIITIPLYTSSTPFMLFRHSGGYVVVPYCGFYLHFPDEQLYWASFQRFISYLYIFFFFVCEMPVKVFYLFLLGCLSYYWLFIFFGYKYRISSECK